MFVEGCSIALYVRVCEVASCLGGAGHELSWSCMKLAYVSDGAFIYQIADPASQRKKKGRLAQQRPSRREEDGRKAQHDRISVPDKYRHGLSISTHGIG